MEQSGVINGHYLKVSGFAFNEVAILGNPQCSYGSSYGLLEHKTALWRLHVFVHNIIETLWCYKWTLLNSLEICF